MYIESSKDKHVNFSQQNFSIKICCYRKFITFTLKTNLNCYTTYINQIEFPENELNFKLLSVWSKVKRILEYNIKITILIWKYCRYHLHKLFMIIISRILVNQPFVYSNFLYKNRMQKLHFCVTSVIIIRFMTNNLKLIKSRSNICLI